MVPLVVLCKAALFYRCLNRLWRCLILVSFAGRCDLISIFDSECTWIFCLHSLCDFMKKASRCFEIFAAVSKTVIPPVFEVRWTSCTGWTHCQSFYMYYKFLTMEHTCIQATTTWVKKLKHFPLVKLHWFIRGMNKITSNVSRRVTKKSKLRTVNFTNMLGDILK